MHTDVNEHIVKQFYNNILEGNVQAAMAQLDEDILWVEPGAPEVPFGGSYKGLLGIGQMLTSEHKLVQLKNFTPTNYFGAHDLVVVLGSDSAAVLTTGKSYSTDWTMFFTLSNGKITKVQTYMDTNAIAKAFMP